MYAQVEKSKENKSKAVANSAAQKKSNGKQGYRFDDNRQSTIAQRQQIAIMSKHGVLQRVNGLDEMPVDMLREIAKKLGPKDIVSFGSTNKEKALIALDVQWRNAQIAWNDFGEMIDDDGIDMDEKALRTGQYMAIIEAFKKLYRIGNNLGLDTGYAQELYTEIDEGIVV
ncbi:F-box protein [Leptothoe sp. EHU-05/26/07-4]